MIRKYNDANFLVIIINCCKQKLNDINAMIPKLQTIVINTLTQITISKQDNYSKAN